MPPLNGDIWESMMGRRFTVTGICDTHDPTHIHGQWWGLDRSDRQHRGPNPCAPGSIPAPVFVSTMKLIQRGAI